jgi:hypothetical protein
MEKKVFEIYPTSSYIDGKEWLKLILKVSKINGIFKPWNLWVHIENNYIRYFIETKRTLPPILGELGDFLIKKTDMVLREKWSLGVPFMLTNNYKTLLDVYDRFDTRKSQKIKNIKITIFPHKHNNYISTTHLYIKNEDGKLINKKVFFNSSIYNFISVDFDTHIRFFYQKNEAKYLDTKKVLNILGSDKENAVLEADVFPYLQEELYLNYKNYDFAKHSIVIGASGTGKSKLISSMIKNLDQSKSNKLKYKVVVIDPHAAMEEDIGGLKSADVIDFKTDESSINLFANSSDDIISEVESIMDIFKNIIADRYNSKLERVLRYSIHLLLQNGNFNLVNLRKLLTEIEYRNKVIKAVQDEIQPNIIEFFRVDFNELKTQSYQEAISPIISFIDEMQLLPAMSETTSVKNIKEEIEQNFITILSLDQTTLGLNITKTIAGFAMQQILQLVQAHTFDEHIILVIDEVSVIETPIIGRFLSEARKYNLSLILAGQYFEQISNNLQKAIFTNVVNYFIFRVSRMDAMILEKNIQMEVAVRNSITIRLKMLTELNDRECIVRIGKDGRMLSAFKGRTLDFEAVPRKKVLFKKQNIQKIKDKIETKKAFNIDTKNNLKDMMTKQSTSRKRINLQNN